jgi:alkanesulfonate monooxygenase SsuD/methylene tetrahydromethanopterin reductase-like flavin-dependent oxidoreductase (luciferase family)
MRYGLDISSAGPWGDPRTIAELAALAEQSGWDAVFLEDYVFFHSGLEMYDPWVTLAAVALATERVTIGTLVTPLPRRRVWKVAAEAMTLDHLSGGRMVLGVGSGDPTAADFSGVGEPADSRTLAAVLDESLEVLAGLWSGEPVTHHGEHVDVTEVTLRPGPVQRPRIPIWVGGCLARTGPRERALRWDGACLYGLPVGDWHDLTAADVHELRQTARARRGDDTFVVAVGGRQRRDDLAAEVDYVTSLAEAGTDWWHEYVEPTTPLEVARTRIAGGPIRARPS